MLFKQKKLLSILIAVSLLCSICLPPNTCTIFASTTTPVKCTQTCDNVTWSLTFEVPEAGATVTPTISIQSINGDGSYITYPSFDDIHSCLPGNYNYSKTLKVSANDAAKLIAAKTNTIIIKDGYTNIPAELFTGNSFINKINVEAGNTAITFANQCFANMQSLNQFELKAASVTFEGSAFDKCSALNSLIMNAPATFANGYNFSGCSSLETANFKNTDFIGTSPDFTETTFTNTKKASVIFNGTVTNVSSVFSKCGETIEYLNLNGSNNVIHAGFLTDTSVLNFNIQGSTVLKSKAISDNGEHFITKFSINKATTFGNGALNGLKITKFYFNVDNRDNIRNLAYESANDRMGYHTKVENMYFNYKDINQNPDVFEVLQNFPLGDTKDTSLNCDAIYFQDPHMCYIDNISTYDRCDGGETKVYGYGGANCTDSAGNRISSYQMFNNWIKGKHCSFVNYVTSTTSLTPTTVIYLSEHQDTYSYDFSDSDNFTVTGTYYNKKTPYDDLTSKLDPNTGSMPLKLSLDANTSSNFNYRILEKTANYSGQNSTSYVYEYNNNWYTPIQNAQMNLNENNHEFLLEVGGEMYPFNINVVRTSIKEIQEVTSTSGSSIVLNYGDEVTKDMLRVKAVFSDGSTGYLANGQYDLQNATIISDKQIISVSAKDAEGNSLKPAKLEVTGRVLTSLEVTPVSGNNINLTYNQNVTKDMLRVKATFSNGDTEYLTSNQYVLNDTLIKSYYNKVKISTNYRTPTTIFSTLDVYGYPDEINDFTAVCNYDTLPEKSTLTTDDVYLTNIIYANPSQESPEKVENGFRFLVNDKETDEVTIKPGENKISITYGNHTVKDAITITGTESSITKVEAIYLGNGIYEGQQLELTSSNLAVFIYKEGETTGTLVSDFSKITLSSYEVVANKDTVISVYYNNIKADEDIQVPGLKDEVAEISNIRYNGPTSKGTKLKSEDFYVEIKLLSGTVINSVDNPELLNSMSFSQAVLNADVNIITVYYNHSIAKSVTILGIGTLLTTPPTEGVIVPTTGTENTPSSNIQSDAPEDTSSTKAPGNSVPNQTTATPSPTSTKEGSATNGTNTNANTDPRPTLPSAPANPQPISESIKKGKTYLVNNIQCKVLSITKNNYHVSVIGYKTSGKTVKVPTTVKIQGTTFQVTEIATNAFKNCKTLKGNVYLQGRIETIGSNAFSGCRNIKKVTIGSKVRSIGSNAFYNCRGLSQVNLCSAKSLKKVGSKAFKNNSNSRRFKISSGTRNFFAKLLKGKY